MNKVIRKQQDELQKASPVIKQLGYIPNENMCGDAPDIVLPSINEGRIGIEVVNYSTHRYEEAENALYKLFQEYIETVLDKKTTKRYEIGVLFYSLEVPVDINFKEKKEELFKEFDSFFFPKSILLERKYVAELTFMENPGVEHSFITCDKVVVCEHPNESTLLECINKKENKLKSYKIMLKNQSIKHYFLVIYFPFNEHVELRGYELPKDKDFKTNYDRIYLVDSFHINQIK